MTLELTPVRDRAALRCHDAAALAERELLTPAHVDLGGDINLADYLYAVGFRGVMLAKVLEAFELELTAHIEETYSVKVPRAKLGAKGREAPLYPAEWRWEIDHLYGRTMHVILTDLGFGVHASKFGAA